MIEILLGVIALLLGIIASALLFGGYITLIGLGALAGSAVIIAAICGMSRENRLVTAMTLFSLALLAGVYVYSH